MGNLTIEPIKDYGLNIDVNQHNKPMFSKIGVIGGGKDGRTIIYHAATSGMEVIFLEDSQEWTEYAMTKIDQFMDEKIQSWGLTQSEKKVIMNRITPTLNYDDFKGCDLVIECTRHSEDGTRNKELRKEVFKKLENVLDEDAIIASNSSTVIISELAAELTHKNRCVATYFPVAHPDARILEISKGMYTSDEVYNRMEIFAKLINYLPHKINESNGNVSMRIMVTMLNEACQVLMERICTMKEIEETFTIIYGQRMGIFEMADRIGIGRIVMIMEEMFNDYGKVQYKPNPILWKLYRSKQFGKLIKKGFYIYDDNGNIISENPTLFN